MTMPPQEPFSDPNQGAADFEPTQNLGAPAPGYQNPGPGAYGQPNWAPFGVDPLGRPYSDKSKVVAGILQILLPLGIGRFYTGHTSLGVAQLLVSLLTCGLGAIWPVIDGVIILVSDSTDAQGRLLRS